MSKFASRGRLAAVLCVGAAVCAVSAAAFAQRATQPPAKGAIPDLASVDFAWLAMGADWRDPPAGSGHGPIKPDPDHPFHSNVDGPGQVTIRLGDTKDPVLKPWAAAQMLASNEEAISGKRAVPFAAHGLSTGSLVSPSLMVTCPGPSTLL